MNQLNANRRKPVVKLTAEDIVGPQGPGRLIRCLYRQMVGLSEAQFPETDLSFIHWLSLMLVHDGVVVTAGDLAKETMMTTGAITRLVDVLEDRRLLIRDRCGADRRVVRLRTTAEGEARIQAMAPVLAAAWNDLLTDFDSDEYDHLIQCFVKLTTAFSAFAQRAAGPAQREKGAVQTKRKHGSKLRSKVHSASPLLTQQREAGSATGT